MPGDEHDAPQVTRPPIELRVEYKRLNTFFSDYTRNISRGGTFIKTSKPLPVGTEFLFLLHVPNLAAPLAIHGEVSRFVTEQQAEASRSEAGMGIVFVYRHGDSRSQISATVEHLMTHSLGARITSRLLATPKQADAPEPSQP